MVASITLPQACFVSHQLAVADEQQLFPDHWDAFTKLIFQGVPSHVAQHLL